ncbi:hypothetical protein Tco_1061359 [Tanacetum coccineum]
MSSRYVPRSSSDYFITLKFSRNSVIMHPCNYIVSFSSTDCLPSTSFKGHTFLYRLYTATMAIGIRSCGAVTPLAILQSVYQEQWLTKKINALHLSSGKQIMALKEEISNLNKQLSKEKLTVSSLQEEKRKLKSNFKIREDELLNKQIQLENKIKELDNILVKTGQSIQTMHMLSPKPDSVCHTPPRRKREA